MPARAPRLLALLLLAAVAPAALAAVTNLARAGTGALYGAAGADGVAVLDPASGDEAAKLDPPEGWDGVHDVAVADALLFALDAAAGRLAVYSLADPRAPKLLPGTRDVNVRPFSGVSAGGGRVVVSGGTGDMRLFDYSGAGDLTPVGDGLDLGTGQPDVLVDARGDFAYVSTDFSGAVDGSGFGITAVDLAAAARGGGAEDVVTHRVGLDGAGFTDGVRGNANFPVESAIAGDRLLVAHGGGLSVLSLGDRAAPALESTVPLDFPAVNVDADGDLAVVVGGQDRARVAAVDLKSLTASNVEVSGAEDSGGATAVAVTGTNFVVAAEDAVLACDDDCERSETSASNGDGNEGDDDGDSGICVEERYLLDRGVPRSALLHEGSLENVLCPGHGLPCGSANHVVRFHTRYLSYTELCQRDDVSCVSDKKVVNGVSMMHAGLLCGGDDKHCVVPHVMWTGSELERSVVKILHSSIVTALRK